MRYLTRNFSVNMLDKNKGLFLTVKTSNENCKWRLGDGGVAQNCERFRNKFVETSVICPFLLRSA